MKKEKLKLNQSLEIYYRKYFSEKNKENILILHWWWWSSDSWIEVSHMLDKAWYNLIVPDLPGFGDTKIDKIYDVWDYAEIVEIFIEKLWLSNQEFYLLWHSNWWRISIILENRKIIKIKKLILNNSAWIKRVLSKKQKVFKIITKIFKVFKWLPWAKKLRELYYKAIWAHDYLKAENPLIKKTFLNMINSNLIENIKKIKTETLIIWWEKDSYTPLSDWKIMEKNIKNSKLIILDWERHGIHLQNPKRLFNTIIENI